MRGKHTQPEMLLRRLLFPWVPATAATPVAAVLTFRPAAIP